MRHLSESISSRIEESIFTQMGIGDAYVNEKVIRRFLDPKLVTIVPGGLIDYSSSVYMSRQDFEKLPLRFRNVAGDFTIANCRRLKSLEGCPEIVGGSFKCFGCEDLISLEGCPEIVGMHFDCCRCTKLKSLEGMPDVITGSFDCSECVSLRNLKGCPKTIGGDFTCMRCTGLTTFSYRPRSIQGNFYCGQCGVKEPDDAI